MVVDAEARGEGLGLLHGVRREQHGGRQGGAAAARRGRGARHGAVDGAPERAARPWVKATAGLVEDGEARRAHQRESGGELPLVAAAQDVGVAVRLGWHYSLRGCAILFVCYILSWLRVLA